MTRREVALLGLILLLATCQLVLFAAFDRRGLDDHDPFFAGPVATGLEAFSAAELTERPGLLWDFATRDFGLHPRLAQTWLLGFCGTFGWNEQTLRLANLPWALLLVVGTWLLGRELGSVRAALLSAFIVSTLPVFVQLSRKFFIQFHAAALVPLSLAIALSLLRTGRGARWWLWGAFGLVVGLRLSSHPVQLVDTVALIASTCILVPLATKQGPGRWRAGAWALGAVAVGSLIGAPWLFGGSPEAESGFRFYLRHAQRFTNLDFLFRGDLAPLGGGVRAVVRHLWTAWWMPPATILVFLPGVLAWGASLRRGRHLGLTPRAWLTLLVGLQLPALLISVTNAGFVSDWFFLLPTVVTLALAALDQLVGPRLPAWARMAWLALVLAQGLGVVAIPIVASLRGPDPVHHPEAYMGPVLVWFTRTEHGGTGNTHHLLSRRDSAGAELANWAIDRSAEPTVPVGLWDLTWDWNRESPSSCDPPSAERDAWLWQGRESAHEPLEAPFAMRGRHVRWLQAPETGEALHVVTLWYDGPESEEYMVFACPVDERFRPEMVRGAVQIARTRFGESAHITTISDPLEWFVGNVDPTGNPDRHYWNVSLLVDARGP